MRRPIKTRKDLEIASDHFLRRRTGYPLGGTLTELDYLRGWKDDFFGDLLQDQYAVAQIGGGSVTLVNNSHGGWAQILAAAGAANYTRLWLGNAADGFATLDADYGWTMLVRMALESVVSVSVTIGSMNSTLNDFIFCGFDSSALGGRWNISVRTGGGAVAQVDSGIASDAATHMHRIDVYPITGGRQVDYYLDGNRIAFSTHASIPPAVLTPLIRVYNRGAATRSAYPDYWAVIPRNL